MLGLGFVVSNVKPIHEEGEKCNGILCNYNNLQHFIEFFAWKIILDIQTSFVARLIEMSGTSIYNFYVANLALG